MKQTTGKENENIKIYQGVFDDYTMKTLVALHNRGYFSSLLFPISTGKEADVYCAQAKRGFVALKIYRVETSNFQDMEKYVVGDPRFQDMRPGKRSMVSVWCQKEFRNLRDAKTAGVRVPTPIKFLNNVLVMEFIGTLGMPAPVLQKTRAQQPEKIVKKMVEWAQHLYKAGLVHADLSEYNVLLKPEPVLIDIGQAVSLKHPNALEFLRRDLQNIQRFAQKNHVEFDAQKEFEKIIRL